MATISDVARRAGVSTATVSRALNGKSTVDPVLVARVRAAADELGYHPNGLARNLRRQETAVLALIISDVENPFFTAIARGVEDTAQTAGYSVVLCNSDENPEKEQRYIDVALQERVAGVVLSPTDVSSSVERLRQRGTPVVAVDRPLVECDQVLVDSRLAAREATEHLISSGYTRIGCVTGPAGVRTADDRLAGYRDALDAAGRGPRLERRAEYRASGGRQATEDLLGDAPDALLVANSAMAIGVLEALGEAGLRLGRDVGVVAFDDVPWATLIDPPLTVVAQPAREIGAEAARLLLARIGEPATPPVATTLAAHLIERGSTRRG
ncbi:LacI family transcriptional regulator [Amycolatopsis acidiphila]|uniref:LacI family transcriptional regulator n=1 Tax=Amycolatopsis acidiphila TaxID=715473 RepID=A0A558A0Q0_9PSEU|nr:LacI family DNA-binding transcriptional regulator [Amycolatopsis acidiphila]TVT17848.1 LacI family transcriptional regulator [Amycolatopsis acidiphila]UIJ62239.1 LacI family transcriptional regulator [Amycolatopsis acidiphila]GHG92813.1 LacI family transcriptional regulator [Amycolatopsis acidiphila]